MIIQLDKTSLFNTFHVSCFNQLEEGIQSVAPSMVEYHLDDLSSSTNEPVYINKSNIQQTIYLDQYSLYLDYEDLVYLEFIEKDDTYDTESLW
ncbi:MAG: hypothetical protein WBG69_01910 [Arcobacteraceae bacterium]